jgi:hypothetical protein
MNFLTDSPGEVLGERVVVTRSIMVGTVREVVR